MLTALAMLAALQASPATAVETDSNVRPPMLSPSDNDVLEWVKFSAIYGIGCVGLLSVVNSPGEYIGRIDAAASKLNSDHLHIRSMDGDTCVADEIGPAVDYIWKQFAFVPSMSISTRFKSVAASKQSAGYDMRVVRTDKSVTVFTTYRSPRLK